MNDPRLNEAALSVIGQMGEIARDAIEPLSRLVRSPNRPLAATAIRTLARLGSEAVPHLVAFLDDATLDSFVVQPTEMDRFFFGGPINRETLTGEVCAALARLQAISELREGLGSGAADLYKQLRNFLFQLGVVR
jgi:HEAT repeat protein